MPRILDLKTDEKGNLWANVGRPNTPDGMVTLLTNEEIEAIKRHERERFFDVIDHAHTHFDEHEGLIYAKS